MQIALPSMLLSNLAFHMAAGSQKEGLPRKAGSRGDINFRKCRPKVIYYVLNKMLSIPMERLSLPVES